MRVPRYFFLTFFLYIVHYEFMNLRLSIIRYVGVYTIHHRAVRKWPTNTLSNLWKNEKKKFFFNTLFFFFFFWNTFFFVGCVQRRREMYRLEMKNFSTECIYCRILSKRWNTEDKWNEGLHIFLIIRKSIYSNTFLKFEKYHFVTNPLTRCILSIKEPKSTGTILKKKN